VPALPSDDRLEDTTRRIRAQERRQGQCGGGDRVRRRQVELQVGDGGRDTEGHVDHDQAGRRPRIEQQLWTGGSFGEAIGRPQGEKAEGPADGSRGDPVAGPRPVQALIRQPLWPVRTPTCASSPLTPSVPDPKDHEPVAVTWVPVPFSTLTAPSVPFSLGAPATRSP
jgi:hypothetical protein